MNLQTIGEHTIYPGLLTGGVAIDVGCLGFEFSKGIRDLGCQVHAFDVVDLEPVEGIQFKAAAITHEDSKVWVSTPTDRQAWHVNDTGTFCVETISLNTLFSQLGDHIDVLKLDCEGSEYKILSDPEFKPIARQISIEFHMHCHADLHDEYYDKCMENLLKYYEPVQHFLSVAHGSGLNYWDSLFIRRDFI